VIRILNCDVSIEAQLGFVIRILNCDVSIEAQLGFVIRILNSRGEWLVQIEFHNRNQ